MASRIRLEIKTELNQFYILRIKSYDKIAKAVLTSLFEKRRFNLLFKTAIVNLQIISMKMRAKGSAVARANEVGGHWPKVVGH